MNSSRVTIRGPLARLTLSLAALSLIGCADPDDPTSGEVSSSGGPDTYGGPGSESGTDESTGGTGTTGESADTSTTGGSTDTSTTGGSADTSSTSGTEDTSSTSGTEDTSSTGGSSTDEGTTGTSGATDGETGSTGGGSLCEVICEWEDRCGEITQSCVTACDTYLETGYELDQGCGDARTALVQCRVDASDCEDFLAPGCDAERSDVHMACNGDPTPFCGDVGFNEDPIFECVLEVGCVEDPNRRVECNADGCGCWYGGSYVGGCAPENPCEIDDVAGLALECCGWDDFHEY